MISNPASDSVHDFGFVVVIVHIILPENCVIKP